MNQYLAPMPNVTSTDRRIPSKGERRWSIAVFALTSTLFAVAMTGFFIAIVIPRTGSSMLWLGLLLGAIGGLLFGAGMTALVKAVWSRNGGIHTSRLIQKAIASRQLPADIDPGQWVTLLTRQERDANRGRWLYPLFFGTASALYLLAALTRSLPDLGIIPWIGVAFFGAFTVYAPFETVRRLRGIRDLRAALATRRHGSQELP